MSAAMCVCVSIMQCTFEFTHFTKTYHMYLPFSEADAQAHVGKIIVAGYVWISLVCNIVAIWEWGFYQLNGAQTGWPVKGLLPWHFGSCGLQIVRGQRKGVPDAFSSIGRCRSDQFLGSIPCFCSGPYVMCGAASLVSTRECSCWIK